MPVYGVFGKLGAGKSLSCVGRIRTAIREKRRIATNLDLHLVPMLGPAARAVDVVRLPDKPTVADLEALGNGSEEIDETRNGLIVLDELGTWLNSRSWADPTRQAVINWLLHSRKLGWDVVFIIQHQNMIDKQVRDGVLEYAVHCRRLDRMRIPLVGGLIKLVSGGLLSGRMPKLHVGVVRYGLDRDSIVADRWVTLGTDLYAAYDTRQVFRDDYPHGPFSLLSPWHTDGRYLNRPTWRERLRRLLDGPPPRRLPINERFPLSVRALPADLRWHVARRLAAGADAVPAAPRSLAAWGEAHAAIRAASRSAQLAVSLKTQRATGGDGE